MSEEAAQRQVEEALSHGLREWVDRGACPPALLKRIEFSIAEQHKRTWWRSWSVLTGAAAAVLVLLVFASRAEQVGQFAALVGTMTAQLVSPGTGGLAQEPMETFRDGFRMVRPNMADEHEGIRLHISQIAYGFELTRVHYSLRGQGLDTTAEQGRYALTLETADGPVALRSLAIIRGRHELVVEAEYEPVSGGLQQVFTVRAVPMREPAPVDHTWRISLGP
jgi:hypothetical protein